MKASTHIGLEGTILTMAASPDLMNLGAFSIDLPVRRSIFSKISENLHAMWAVWQSSTGAYPAPTWPGWLRTMTWALKESAPFGGSFLESPATLPRRISLTETFLTLKPTLSPGRPSTSCSWCISTDLTSVVTPVHRVSGLSNPGVNGWPTSWGEGHNHASLDNTSLNTSDGNRANTTDLIHILERETERLVSRTSWRFDGVNCLKQGLAAGLCFGFLLPPLVPGAVGGVIDHVITIETGDGHEGDGLGVVSNLLDEVGGFLDDLVEAILGPFGGVHLVDSDDQLLDTQGVGE